MSDDHAGPDVSDHLSVVLTRAFEAWVERNPTEMPGSIAEQLALFAGAALGELTRDASLPVAVGVANDVQGEIMMSMLAYREDDEDDEDGADDGSGFIGDPSFEEFQQKMAAIQAEADEKGLNPDQVTALMREAFPGATVAIIPVEPPSEMDQAIEEARVVKGKNRVN